MTNQATILVTQSPQPLVEERELEIVEHKGVGHPDTLTDSTCEAAATALAGAYRASFGAVMHFNVDKGLLVAGRSAPRFNGGAIVEPARLIICGRATDAAGRFDIGAIAGEAARRHLATQLRRGASNIRVEHAIRRGSAALEAIYADTPHRANDTSYGVGYWPYTRLELTVLTAARLLHSSAFFERFPAAGDDFKVMGVRRRRALELTIAIAMVDSEISNVAHYFDIKRAMTRYLGERLGGATVQINALDDANATDESGLYLAVTGLSAEMGDDGQVGRGNRVNGLITPGRPMSLEAAAGKNPAAHVGKIYNVLAASMARTICERMPDVREANVQLVSRIGQPIDEPWAVSVELCPARPLDDELRAQARRIAAEELSRVSALSLRLERDGLPNAIVD